MSKNLKQLIDLDKIESVWLSFLQDYAEDNEEGDKKLKLNKLERVILKSIIETCKNEIDDLYY